MDSGERNIILVVDDDKRIKEFLEEALGYYYPKKQIVCAVDGVEAWDKIQQSSNLIQLIITDRNMDRMDGVELTQRVKKSFPEIPVLLTSGRNEPDNHQADDFIGKPYGLDALHEKIEKLIS